MEAIVNKSFLTLVFETSNDVFIKQVGFYLSYCDLPFSSYMWPGFKYQPHFMYTYIICASTSYL